MFPNLEDSKIAWWRACKERVLDSLVVYLPHFKVGYQSFLILLVTCQSKFVKQASKSLLALIYHQFHSSLQYVPMERVW